MSNITKFNQGIRVGVYAADPGVVENGTIIYRSDINEFRMAKNGSFQTITAGSISLIGQSLLEYEIIVGDSGDLSAAVDTDALGDIRASSTGGLEIKAGAIVNADVNASAAIEVSKLQALTADRAVQTNGSGVLSASAVTSTELGYVSGVTSAIQTQLNAKLNKAGDTMSGDLNMGGNEITNLGAPVAATDAATKGYVDAVAEGLKPKEAVRAATTAAITIASDLNVGDVIDGVTLADGDRVLVKNQAAAEENGIYVAGASPARATDFDSLTPIDEINGAYVAVQEGTANQGKLFVQYGVVATLNTDPINFTFFNSVAGLIGGDGITVSGSTISVDHDGEGLAFVANQLALELDGGTLSKSASGLKVADAGISNAQINAAAAIELSKLEALTVSRALQSDGAGEISVSAVTSTELGYLSGVTSSVQTQLNGKASQALDNLAAVAINTSLISDTDNTDDLGSAAINWKDVHAKSLQSSSDVLVNANAGAANLNVRADEVRRSKDGSNFVVEEYIDAETLANNLTNSVISSLSFAHASFEGMEMVYKIKEATSNRVRIGTVRVATNGTDVSLTDTFADTGDVGVDFSAAINGANVEIRFTTSNSGNARTLRADVKRIRA